MMRKIYNPKTEKKQKTSQKTVPKIVMYQFNFGDVFSHNNYTPPAGCMIKKYY